MSVADKMHEEDMAYFKKNWRIPYRIRPIAPGEFEPGQIPPGMTHLRVTPVRWTRYSQPVMYNRQFLRGVDSL